MSTKLKLQKKPKKERQMRLQLVSFAMTRTGEAINMMSNHGVLATNCMGLSKSIRTACNPKSIIAFGATFCFSVFTQHAKAQYNGSVNPLSQNWSLPSENTLNFSSTANDQSYTCSFGGGTRSMVYAGLFSGIDQTFVQNNITNTKKYNRKSYSRCSNKTAQQDG